MARAFYHNLYVVIPCSLGQFSKSYQLFNLTYICGICQTTRSAGITQRNGHIILFADIKDFIIILVKRIFLSGHAHPCKYQTSATAYDVHFTFMFFDLFNGLSCNSTVECHKIHSIFGMHPNDINKISGCQCSQISLIMDDAVINRNGTDHGRTFACQLSSEWLGISVAGQIHDCLSAQIYCAHYFLHLNIVIFTVSGYSQIYIDLGTQHAADSLRIQAGMIPVCANGYFTLCYQLHQRLGRHMFFLRNSLDLRCHDSFSCCVHLCCVISHLVLLLLFYGFS